MQISSNNPVLDAWNLQAPEHAFATILPCNGSRAWAEQMVGGRPFPSAETLLEAAVSAWLNTNESDRQEAFASHPRLGEKKAAAATEQSLRWSEGEQSTLVPDLALQTDLAEANRAYEAKFGRIFLLCATGKTIESVLASLKQRLGNDAATELRVAAEEQRRITQLRLRKWLNLLAAGCDAV